MKQNKVATNLQQDFTDAEQEQGRANISATRVRTVHQAGPNPTEYAFVPEVQYRYSNRVLNFGNDNKGMLAPEPTYVDDGYYLRASWIGGASGTSTSCRWEPLPNIPCDVVIYSGSPSMSDEQYAQIRNAANAHKMVYVLYGSGGGASYWKLESVSSSGYKFSHRNDDSVQIMNVSTSKAVTIDNIYTGAPKVFYLGGSIWYDTLTINGQSSGTHIRDMLQFTSEPVVLSAGHRYLITTSTHGTADYTTATGYSGSARWSMTLILTNSNYDTTWPNSITLTAAQFWFNNNKGSNTTGYHFNVAMPPNTFILQPTSNLSLDHLVWMNSGNALGASESNTAKMYLDYDLGYVVVQEIPPV